jgi:hypothetical protein
VTPNVLTTSCEDPTDGGDEALEGAGNFQSSRDEQFKMMMMNWGLYFA